MKVAEQLKILLNAMNGVKIYTNSRPLLEISGNTSQVPEMTLRQLVVYLKQCLEDREVDLYARIEVEEIVADVMTKQGSKRDEINEIMVEGYFRNALDEKNCVRCKEGEIKIEN